LEQKRKEEEDDDKSRSERLKDPVQTQIEEIVPKVEGQDKIFVLNDRSTEVNAKATVEEVMILWVGARK
jgi:hypothetical protein